MMPGERISLLLLRDNGASRRFRMRRRLFVLLVVLCLCMPFALGGSVWFGLTLWFRHEALQQQYQTLERQYQEALATATRLGNLEGLLQQRDVAEQAVLARRLAGTAESSNGGLVEEPTAGAAEGPGHSEFPIISTGFIAVDNVHIRLLQGNRLRVTLNLRNPEPNRAITGSVGCTLVTAGGENVPVHFQPADAGDFRISRLKKAVLMATLPSSVSAANAQAIIEVKSEKGEVGYRNVFPVAR